MFAIKVVRGHNITLIESSTVEVITNKTALDKMSAEGLEGTEGSSQGDMTAAIFHDEGTIYLYEAEGVYVTNERGYTVLALG